MLYRPKPPVIEAFQFNEDWEDKPNEWPEWLEKVYETSKLVAIYDSERVAACYGDKIIFFGDYLVYDYENYYVVQENLFIKKYEAA